MPDQKLLEDRVEGCRSLEEPRCHLAVRRRQQEWPAAGTAAETVVEGAAVKPGRRPAVPAMPADGEAGWEHREAKDAAREQ
jgi:hypothetical protein